MELSFTDVRDPELDVQTAAIDNGTFWMSGWVELRTPKGRRGTRMRLGRHIFVVRVPHAESFVLDNPCGTSVLIMEKVAQSLTTVCIEGILPCTAIVKTSHPSYVEFLAEERPTYVRRLFRWSRARDQRRKG